MIIASSIDNCGSLKEPLVLTMGNFDGLHRGHKKVIRKVISRARELNGTPALLTFEPHPRMFLHPDSAPPLLLTRDEKVDILNHWGIELFIEIPFTTEFSGKSAEDFLSGLYDHLSPRELYVGEDFRFGAGREGNGGMIGRFAESRGLHAEAVKKLVVEGDEVSSTVIRRYVAQGNMEKAHLLMGRPFEIRGEVVRGAMRGRKIGFPTANIELGGKIVPARGSYITIVDIGEEFLLPSVSNIGLRPTFHDLERPILEIHVLDRELDLYGRSLRCLFIQKIRDEMEFSGVEELVGRIEKDKEIAQGFLRQFPILKRKLFRG